MKTFCALLFLLSSLLTAQKIKLDSVLIQNPHEDFIKAYVPKLVTKSKKYRPAVDSINQQLLHSFELESYDGDAAYFGYTDINARMRMLDTVLYLYIKSEFMAAYPVTHETEQYFSLTTGQQLPYYSYTFSQLFTPQGYFEFLEKYWLKKAKNALKAAEECANGPSYCNAYDIMDYKVQEDSIMIQLSNQCFPHVTQFCSPMLTVKVALTDALPYMNLIGQKIVNSPDYYDAHPIRSYLCRQAISLDSNLNNSIAHSSYIIASIADQYPISMTLIKDPKGNISGNYYYNKVGTPIDLKGKKEHQIIHLTERSNGEITGYFEISIHPTYQNEAYAYYNDNGEEAYFTGKWYNADRSKVMNVKIEEIKIPEILIH